MSLDYCEAHWLPFSIWIWVRVPVITGTRTQIQIEKEYSLYIVTPLNILSQRIGYSYVVVIVHMICIYSFTNLKAVFTHNSSHSQNAQRNGDVWSTHLLINTLRPRQNGRHFADDIFKCIFLDENVWIPIKISLEFVPKGPINNIPSLVQIMAWRRPGDRPLSAQMMASLPTHICATRPQWVNNSW